VRRRRTDGLGCPGAGEPALAAVGIMAGVHRLMDGGTFRP
jgi:hypothetical protein